MGNYLMTAGVLVLVFLAGWPGPAVLLPPWAADLSADAALWGATAVIASAPLGYLAFALERRLTQVRSRRHLRRRAEVAVAGEPVARIVPASPWDRRPAPHPRPAAVVPTRSEGRPVQSVFQAPAWVLVATGMVEEVLFRGVLIGVPTVYLGWSLPLMAVLGTLWFAAAHVQFGAEQLVLKLPLSLLATGLFLAGGVIPAAVAHAVFNARAARPLALDR